MTTTDRPDEGHFDPPAPEDAVVSLLPLLRCPVTHRPLEYDSATRSLVSPGHGYPIVDGIACLNPAPSDEDLVDFYEQVNAAKTSETELDAFFEFGDVAERYYRQSRRAGLRRVTPPSWGDTVDVGGGSGSLLRSFVKGLDQAPRRLLLVDWARSQMREAALRLAARPELGFLQGDALNLPLRDAALDSAFSSEVLEHVLPGDSQAFLDELFRVLKPGGWLLLTTPNRNEYRRRIQESLLTLMMRARRRDPRSLEERERLKSRLFRRYLALTGHQFSDVDAIEKMGAVGHYNVVTPRSLRRQLERAGFEVDTHIYCIFVPLFHLPGLRRKPLYGRLLGATEKLALALGLGGQLLSCQMVRARRPSARPAP